MEPDALLRLAAEGRAGLKEAARRLDADPALRAAVVGSREIPAEWSSKKLLRAILDRAPPDRSTPVHRDESFTCGGCGREVPEGGRRVRDHCPFCLRSVHLDVVPGDRAADCGGPMEAVGLEVVGGQSVLRYRCRRCGHAHRVRAHPEDDPAQLARVSALPG